MVDCHFAVAYDAWGTVVAHDRYEGSIDQPYQYVGQLGYYTHYQDPDFKLLQLGVRYYDAEIGRFTQRDPIQDGLNWYGYVESDPILNVDPTGNFAIAIPVVGGAAVGIAEGAAFLIGAAAILCGSNQDCREALGELAKSLRDWADGVINSIKSSCRKTLKLRCNWNPLTWNHNNHRHKFTQKNGKICWQYHLQVTCRFAGVTGSQKMFRIPYGPCYKNAHSNKTH